MLAKVFDGLIVERTERAELDLPDAMAKAQQQCKAQGWYIEFTEKPLHGMQNDELPTLHEARAALEAARWWLA